MIIEQHHFMTVLLLLFDIVVVLKAMVVMFLWLLSYSSAFKVKKASCQTPYRAFGAKEMAAQKRVAENEATIAATRRYEDPREAQTTAELRSSLEQQTGKSMT